MIDEHARVDIHSHLVPGVDDGARTLADSLESIERMTGLGIHAILTTPHLDASLLAVPNAAEERIAEVEERFELLDDAVAERFPDVTLMRGFEIMLDDPDPNLSDPRLRMNRTPFVLVEWPTMQVPPGTDAVLRRLRASGWNPVIAHPERYHATEPMVRLAEGWKAAGAFLQVNQGSLTGRYGERVRSRAMALMQAGMADYLASDHHGRPHLEIQLAGATAELEALDAEETIEMLVRTNPRRLVNGEDPLPVPAVVVPSGLRTRLRKIFTSETE